MKIEILDCTLRDGGYVNDWRFERSVISEIGQKLCQSQIEIIEGGFLSQKKKADYNQSIFSAIEDAENCFQNCSERIALMINCGEYNADDIPEYSNGKVTTIRIAFHKHQRSDAQELCVALKSKGYKVFFQPMVTMGYTDFELLSLIEWANEYVPDAFYIVDSFGTMRKEDVLRMFFLIDNNLNNNIKVGFHSHNNLQLSFSNAQELILLASKRTIMIDSSVFGMGRGAGNLCSELITRYINENVESKYDVLPVLEIMDDYIMPIYNQHPWGYSAPYYIAAINNCHPNYATYLMNLQTLCIKDINAIIRSIPTEKRNLFDQELIHQLYMDYQQKAVDDTDTVNSLTKLCVNHQVLLLAPGRSVSTYKDEIQEFINVNNPLVISINHIPLYFRYDRVFISNLKRFKNIDEAISLIKEKVLFTSNISQVQTQNIINYSSYLNDVDSIMDNAGLMLINLMKKIGVSSVTLAGYDGFVYSGTKNYYDDRMVNNVQFEKQKQTNNDIIEYFKKMRKSMDINFLTPSIYDNGESYAEV